MNDFSRGFAVQSLQMLLRVTWELRQTKCASSCPAAPKAACPPISSCSNGRRETLPKRPRRLPSAARTRRICPSRRWGRMGQVRMVAQAVRRAMAAAGITDPEDVHFVQVKCPLLTAMRVKEAEARGRHHSHVGHAQIHGPSRGRARSALRWRWGRWRKRAFRRRHLRRLRCGRRGRAVPAASSFWATRSSCSGMSEGWSARSPSPMA